MERAKFASSLRIVQVQQNIKVAVDAIVFGYAESTLHVLLIKQKFGSMKNTWVLPGGFVKDNESLAEAVHRELKEETGVELKYLEQLYTFGDVARDPRARVISVAYFGTVNPETIDLQPTTDAEDARWFPVNEIPKLGFDHEEIIYVARERLKAKLSYQPIGFELLSSEFPFSDLENLYKTILSSDAVIDRRNFRKKIMSFGFVEETGEVQKSGSGRPAKLFRFNHSKYRRLCKQGIVFDIKFV